MGTLIIYLNSHQGLMKNQCKIQNKLETHTNMAQQALQ